MTPEEKKAAVLKEIETLAPFIYPSKYYILPRTYLQRWYDKSGWTIHNEDVGASHIVLPIDLNANNDRWEMAFRLLRLNEKPLVVMQQFCNEAYNEGGKNYQYGDFQSRFMGWWERNFDKIQVALTEWREGK